jgi:hypothetical protein
MSKNNITIIWSLLIGIFVVITTVIGSIFIFNKHYFLGLFNLFIAISSLILFIKNKNKIDNNASKSPFVIIGVVFIIIDSVVRGIDILEMYDLIDHKYHIAMWNSINFGTIGLIFISIRIFSGDISSILKKIHEFISKRIKKLRR